MTPEQFVYWLQGYAEISMDAYPNKTEWQVIKDHLATVFNKVTPNRAGTGVPAQKDKTTVTPNNPMTPDPIKPVLPNPWPYPGSVPWTGDPYPNNPNTPWTTPNYPRPEIICSAQPNTSYCSNKPGGYGGSTAYNMTSEIPNVKYDYFTTAKKETIRKINKELSK